MDVPDHLVVTAELPGPAILTMELAASRRAEPNAAWLFGTERTLRFDWETGALEMARPGEAAFFDAVDEASLTDSLMTIAGRTTSCVLEFDVPIAEDVYSITSVRVETTEEVREYGADQTVDCAGESGWRFTDAGRQRIELCGEACSVLQTNGTVSFAVGCAQP